MKEAERHADALSSPTLLFSSAPVALGGWGWLRGGWGHTSVVGGGMAAASTDSGQGSTKITPEALREMLQRYNLSRQEFINTYQIQPLVYIPELPYSAKTTFVIMYVVIFLLALAGNSLVIYIVVKKRAIQTATDIFICSLAVSDLLITFFCIPFTLLQNVSSQWFGGGFLITFFRPQRHFVHWDNDLNDNEVRRI